MPSSAIACVEVHVSIYASMRQRSPSLRLEVNQVKDLEKEGD
ncbi:hypothetical protein PUN28_018539 [Cardiocondyla obscurior]|uniref:Uncharacterized protein n=1 Tax=Cardiocondyla obscurior TaxID=286306 RepID=A0AAW2EFS4_9HYME